MFQDFESKADKSAGKPRLAALREELARQGLDGFIIPHADEHQNEYLPARAERLAWLTGFTGSAGTAVILRDTAPVFVDGRYTLQLRDQTDMSVFSAEDLISPGVMAWLADNLPKGARLGFDPWLHTVDGARALASACAKAGAQAVPVTSNPVDAIWHDQPAAPVGKVAIHPVERAGVLAKTKLRELAATVRKAGASATVITDPASICWAFNIRGSDVSHTPLVLAFAIIPARGLPSLFIDKAKLGVKESAYLTQLADLHAPDAFLPALDALGATAKPVMLDGSLTAKAIEDAVIAGGAKTLAAPDPCRLPRARKNRIERKGAIEAHRRDGAAMAMFLCWLDGELARGNPLDEITIVKKLEACRAQTGERLGMPLKDIAFDTICGTGPNGAIVHYRVTNPTNRPVAPDDLILVDSGAQYEDGTTDITRVIPAAGKGNAREKTHFTLVLKGMIAVSEARFPVGTRGMDIDILARRALWEAGLDYAHGTGHGVGSYLAVHEGPQNISKRGTAALETGMIVSNEPGYYETGSHGIRIENLVMVTAPKVPKGGSVAMHGFETLTLCPIDKGLIEWSLLSRDERRWLNRYHARVWREVSPLVDNAEVLTWLEQACAPLKR